MNEFHDPRLAAMERRLERRLPAEPASALRHRVLMAVEKVTATKSANSAQSGASAYPDLVAVTFSAAAAAALVVTVSAGVVAAGLWPATPPSLVARLRAAGVTDESLLSLAEPTTTLPDRAIAPPRVRPDAPAASRRHPLIEFQKRLEEHL